MQGITARRVAIAVFCLLLPLALLALPRSAPPSADTPPTVSSTPRKLESSAALPWTLAEARAALKRQPDDGYLQYVVLQLARRDDQLAAIRDDIPLFAARRTGRPVERFGIFTSTQALQQELQRDMMLTEPSARTTTGPATQGVALGTLQGPPVVNRPWKNLLAGKNPAVSPLSRCVPEDFYLAEFRSLERLAAALDAGQSWFSFLQVQAAQDATDRQVRQRLQQQLVFDAGDKALAELVEQVAVTGSDPFLGEGSDVTVLVQLRAGAVEAFRSRTERALSAAAEQPGAGRSPGKYHSIDYSYVATADRRLSAYAVTLPDRRLHVRSNSRAALQRVLAAAVGKAPALGTTDEFRYIRTQLPLAANEEDGLIYLPRAFLQRLVSPALQITEARRLVGYNHLRMIANAAELYRTQLGKAPRSLDDLSSAGYAPAKFNEGALTSPVGGTYKLTADGVSGVCTTLGTADNLTPCIDLPLPSASDTEAEAYRDFAHKIGEVSRRWLAPVAIRLQTRSRTVRAEALVLAPPENPAVAELTRLLGKQPEGLEPLPVARRSIASIGLRLNKERWIDTHLSPLSPHRHAALVQLGLALASAVPTPFVARAPWPALVAPDFGDAADTPVGRLQTLGIAPAQLRTLLERGIGSQASLHICDSAAIFDVSVPTLTADLLRAARHGDGDVISFLYEAGFVVGMLTGPAYVAIPVKDPQVVDSFLGQLDDGLARIVPTWRGDLLGTPLQGEFYRLATKAGPPTRSLGVRAGPLRYRVFWARIGDGLYIANQPAILDDLQNAVRTRSTLAASDHGPVAHAMVKLRPANLSNGLPGMRLGQAEANREACQRNVAMLTAAARAFSSTPPVSREALDQETRQRLVVRYAAQLYGCAFTCPDGGRYTLAEDGRGFSCTVHGSTAHPQQPVAPLTAGRLAEATATLTLAPEGVRIEVTLGQR